MSIHLDHETLGAGVLQPTPVPRSVAATPPRRGGFVRVAGTMFGRAVQAGILTTVVAFCLERFAPVDWRPSTILGSFGGRQEAAHTLSAIEARRADVSMQKEEEARAQQETVALQADNERVSAAYKTLFDRGNMLAQQWATAAKEALMLDMQTRVASLKGRSGVSATKDNFAMFCDLGKLFSPDITCGDSLRESAKDDRSAITAEILGNFREQSRVIATSLADWSQGLPDPAQLVAMKAKIDRLYPAARAPVPPPPLGGTSTGSH